MKTQKLKNNKTHKMTNMSSLLCQDKAEVQNNQIKVMLSREHSSYTEDIEECFGDLNVKVEAKYVRKSSVELPMQVLVFLTGAVAGGVFYDFLKIGIKKIVKKFKGTGIRITDKNQNVYNINPEGQMNIFLVPNGKMKVISNIKTIDDLFKCLQEQNNSWCKVKLRDAVNIIGGFAFKSRHFCNEGDSYVVRIKDIKPPFINIQEAIKINMSYYNEQNLKKFRLNKEGFVVAMTGATIGKIGKLITDNKVYINQRVAKFEPYPNVSKQFIYYIIKQNDFQLFIQNNIDSHSAQENISTTSIGNYPILLPTLPEQEAIAEVLSSLDDKIELFHKQNKTLESIAQALFHKWFIEEAKDDWEEQPLSYFGEIICGKTPSKKVHEYFGGNVPFIKIPDMHKNTFVFKTEDTLSELGENSQSKKTLPEKSICVSCIATVGLVSMNSFKSQTNQQINSIIPHRIEYRYFIYLFMKQSKNLLEAMASGGTATMNLNTGNFSNVTVPIADEKIIFQFHDIVNPLFEKIFYNQSHILKLEKLRDTLLPKLMNGTVKIKY